MKPRVVITGLGVVSPIGIGKEPFWDSLIKGKSGVTRVISFDVSSFPTQIAAEIKNFNPAEYIKDTKKIKHLDRFVQLGIAAVELAIEDAKLDLDKEDREKIGVIFGSGIGGIATIEEEHKILLEKGPRKISPFFIPKLIINIAAGEIAINYNLRGPNYAISSACATSAHCVGNGFRLISYGDAEVMVVGGSEASITPLSYGGFCSLRALSRRNHDPVGASRPFDAQRDGFVMGEGAGVIILESLKHAQKRDAPIYGELCGYSATDDAYHVTAPDPEAKGIIKALKLALEDAGLTTEEVEHINAHGTSTKLNDKVETSAIKEVFGDRAYKIPISAPKSMFAHLLGAAGAVEFIATILTVQRGIIPPTINYEHFDPDCDLDYVPNKARQKEVNVAMCTSLGFGGHNAVLVVKKFKE